MSNKWDLKPKQGDFLMELEKLLEEFLNKLASPEIKDADDVIDLEQAMESFVESIEVSLGEVVRT